MPWGGDANIYARPKLRIAELERRQVGLPINCDTLLDREANSLPDERLFGMPASAASGCGSWALFHDDGIPRRIEHPRCRRLILCLLKGDHVSIHAVHYAAHAHIVGITTRLASGAIFFRKKFQVPRRDLESTVRLGGSRRPLDWGGGCNTGS